MEMPDRLPSDPASVRTAECEQHCPTEETLTALWEGRLDARSLEIWSAHVEQCTKCIERLGRMEARILSVGDVSSRFDLAEFETATTLAAQVDIETLLHPVAGDGSDVTSDILLAELAAIWSPPQSADGLGRLGNYRVIRLLGGGGMGSVFLAEDSQLRRSVALKIMRPHMAAMPGARERFLREARAAASINHENVVRIYQVGEERGIPFLAMELLEGETLATRLRSVGRLSTDESLHVARETLFGLAAAHSRGLVHRDIKPANIVLVPTETPGQTAAVESETGAARYRVKIVDFGLARVIDEDESRLTQFGHVAGTPQYMSPEQIEGEEIDTRSDLFSLGCLLYRMLAGEMPFQAKGNAALMRAILDRPHIPLHDRAADTPVAICDFVDRLLAKSPAERFQSANAVIESLDNIRVASAIELKNSHAEESTAFAGSKRRTRFKFATLGLILLTPILLICAWIAYRDEAHSGFTVSPPTRSIVSDESGSFWALSETEFTQDSIDVGETEAHLDAERLAAEWVLRVGGSVALRFPDGSIRSIQAHKDLPDGAYFIESIDVHGSRRVTDQDVVKYVTGLKRLESLELHYTPITDDALLAVKDSASLKNLHLEGTVVSDAGIKSLGTLPKLWALQLNQTRVTEACLPFVVSQPDLRGLNIGSIPSSPTATDAILASDRWQTVSLHESWIQPDNINRLAALTEFNFLGIYGDLPVPRLRLLSTLPHLTTLKLMGHPQWSAEHSASLSVLPTVESLILVNVQPSSGWAELAAARPWVSLKVYGAHLPDEFFDAIDSVEPLVRLQLENTSQSRARLQRFRENHPLIDIVSDNSQPIDRQVAERMLRLGGIAVNYYDHRGGFAVRQIEELPDTEFQIAGIHVIDCSRFDDRLLASLAGLSKLRILGLQGSAVTEAGLTTLGQLPPLSRLDLGRQHNTPLAMDAVARQRSLEWIQLTGSNPAALRRLASLERLSRLTISSTDPAHADEMLRLITTQFPRLRGLYLDTLILQPEQAKLLLELPDLQFLQTQQRCLTMDVIPIIASHPTLWKLYVHGQTGRWDNLSSLLRIRELLIGDGGCSEADVARIAEMPQLQTLTFAKITFTPEAIREIGCLRHVSKLSFTGCDISDDDWGMINAALPASSLLWNGIQR